jgi:hypothetical protein
MRKPLNTRRLVLLVAGVLLAVTLVLAVAGPALAAPTATTTVIVRIQQNDPRVVYAGLWLKVSDPAASGGSYAVTDPRAASATSAVAPAVTFRFVGNSLAWIAQKGPAGGTARVWLDGKNMGLVSLFSPKVLWQQRVWYTGPLAQKTHTVTIAWTGLRTAAITGIAINVDAFDITSGTLTTL